MEPTEEDVEALEDELREIFRYQRVTPETVARHVLSRPAPPGTIRLGTGLTEIQMGWSAEQKRRRADEYDAVACALIEAPWDATAEGLDGCQAIHARFLQMAADLRAAAEPPPDPRIAVVQDTIGRLARTGVPSTDEARAILAALDKVGGAGG